MTIERKIAGKARELVSGQTADYRSLCESLPALLRTAGLAQTTAFLKGKSAEENKELYRHLEIQVRALGLLGPDETLLAKSADAGLAMPQYRMLLELTMLIAFWHKRMAQALIPKAGAK
jgi:CRISPR/Cas system CMR-associated protein Cmr5 small subunit